MNNVRVSVCMITYNHENYINKAIEGFLLQEASFPIELIIGDDCSTDNTRSICEKYARKHPSKILLLESKTNLGVVPNFIRTLEKCHGKYIAICEGDDYWIDPFKVKKQVDFLESNLEYGLVHTNYIVVDENNHPLKKIDRNWPSGDVLTNILSSQYGIVTATVLFRTELMKNRNSQFEISNLLMGDLQLWIEFSRITKLKYFTDKTTCYRLLKESASHTQNLKKIFKFHYQAYLIKKNYASSFKLEFNTDKARSYFYGTMIKEAFLKYDASNANKFYIKYLKLELLNILKIRSMIFFLGAKYQIFRRLIRFIYKLS